MIDRLILPDAMRQRMEDAARAAFPRECCGLIEGMRESTWVRATEVHPTRNLAADEDRFEIDPAAHIAILKRLRGSARDVVGCYHSHPNGRAEPSARDREGASGEDFLWLILAIAQRADGFEATLRAYQIGAHGHREIAIVSQSSATA